jgi:predicted nucleic acid-binding Zn ribbon protein
MKNEKRFCLECGSALKGRSDKRFCNDVCRSASHYRRHEQLSADMRMHNATLRKNRLVLEDFLFRNHPVKHDELIRNGFREGYITQYLGPGHFRVYDIDLKQHAEDSWIILKE